MNTRREFFLNNILSLGVLPLFGNKESLVRWDYAQKAAKLFILDMDKKIKAKIYDTISIFHDNRVDNTRYGIYGICSKSGLDIVTTQIDWLKTYSVSSSMVINYLSDYYRQKGFTKSEPIIYRSEYCGIRLKRNDHEIQNYQTNKCSW